MIGINITPSFNTYITLGVAGTVIDHGMEKRFMVGGGGEFRVNNFIGVKAEYNFILNPYRHVAYGAPGIHMLTLGVNLYVL